MHRVRFIILLALFVVAEIVLWFVASLASRIGIHQPAETLLRHRQLVDWLLDRNGNSVQQWGPEGYRR